jgi:dTDP-4-dehydrorhamnose 3,5-epimerase
MLFRHQRIRAIGMMGSPRFLCTPLAIPGVVAIERSPIGDLRGSFSRLYCSEELSHAGWTWPVAQINHSFTAKAGTVRGLHFQQSPHSEAKLVTCLKGRIWDVAVDLRRGSPTFLQWCACELSGDNNTALLVPPGCAHGFQSLGDDVELLYLHSSPFVEAADAGLNPRDPLIKVDWPTQISFVSEKDSCRPMLDSDYQGLLL